LNVFEQLRSNQYSDLLEADMQARQFERFFQDLGALTRRQRNRLLNWLQASVQREQRGQQAIELIEQAASARLVCRHCGSRHFHKHGHANGLQRYRCRQCGRTCNGLTGTPLARLRHKGHWFDYLDGMLESHSIRRAAGKLGVAGATSFRWRHRFLAMTKHDRAKQLAGIAEADEMFLLESQKGARELDRTPRKRGGKATKRGISNEQVCILVARDRSGQTLDWVPGRGPVTALQLHQHLKARLATDVLLVTDAHAAYRAFARQAGISHATVNLKAGVRVRGAVHVQNVNGYHSRLRGWLQPFRGVATRYLSNYLGWRWALDGKRVASPAHLLRLAIGAFNT
jgi:transposase-like protein